MTNGEDLNQILHNGKIPVVIDPSCNIRQKVKPIIIIDVTAIVDKYIIV